MIQTPEYDGPDRRTSPIAGQHIGDAVALAIQELVKLTPKVEMLSNSVEDLGRANRANKRNLRLLAAAVGVSALGFLSGIVVQFQIKDNSDRAKVTAEVVKSLALRINDCINPDGKCFKDNTLRAREANEARNKELQSQHSSLEERFDTVICLLRILPQNRQPGDCG